MVLLWLSLLTTSQPHILLLVNLLVVFYSGLQIICIGVAGHKQTLWKCLAIPQSPKSSPTPPARGQATQSWQNRFSRTKVQEGPCPPQHTSLQKTTRTHLDILCQDTMNELRYLHISLHWGDGAARELAGASSSLLVQRRNPYSGEKHFLTANACINFLLWGGRATENNKRCLAIPSWSKRSHQVDFPGP